MRKTLIAAPLLAMATLAPPAAAQGIKNHNANAPVDVEADRIEVQDRSDRAVFSGNVKVRQGGLALDSARLTVAYANGGGGGSGVDIQRLDASGGVVVRNADQTARGNVAIYDVNRRLITMVGGVTLKQGPNTINGGRLVMDLNSGRSVIDGSAIGGQSSGVQGTTGGRVTGRFTVPERKTGN